MDDPNRESPEPEDKVSERRSSMSEEEKVAARAIARASIENVNALVRTILSPTALPVLTRLELGGNKLVEVPKEIGQLITLQLLNLDRNNLMFIPAELGNLIALEHLNLDHNNLRSLPAEICHLSALVMLNVNANKLVGLPDELGELTSLTTLRLDDNRLTQLPASIGNLAKLIVLYLSRNAITSIPFELSQLSALTTLLLDDNQLSEIPASLNRLESLTTFFLTHNRLKSVPASLGTLPRLKMLRLGENELTEVPSELSQLSELTSLFLHHNFLTTIPHEFGQLAALTVLLLSENHLKIVPAELGELSVLSMLGLNDNQLVMIPKEFGELTSLTTLRLDNNLIEFLPDEIGNMNALSVLDVSKNQLTVLPMGIEKLEALTSLRADGNHLRCVSPELGNLKSLSLLSLNRNLLTDIPETYASLTNLKELSMDDHVAEECSATLKVLKLQGTIIHTHKRGRTRHSIVTLKRALTGWSINESSGMASVAESNGPDDQFDADDMPPPRRFTRSETIRKKVQRSQRQRQIVRLFEKNLAESKMTGGSTAEKQKNRDKRNEARDEINKVLSMSDNINTRTNLPYALINLAIDRHHGRHLDHAAVVNRAKTLKKKKKQKPIKLPSAIPEGAGGKLLKPLKSKSGRVKPAKGKSGSLMQGLRRSKEGGASLWKKKVAEHEEDFSAVASEQLVKGNELGLAYQAWMEGHLNMYQACIKPVADEKNKRICKCGRPINPWGKHSIKPKTGVFDVVVEAAVEEELTWSADRNCHMGATTTYGLMLFREDDTKRRKEMMYKHINAGKPYCRVSATDCTEHPEWIRNMLVTEWDLDPPRILLSVTGGAKEFNLPPKLDEMIKLGLQTAAKTESLWITSGGTNSGVMRYVGKAINGHGGASNCPVIAISAWSIIHNKELLETHPDGNPMQGGLAYYGRITDKSPELALDQNHTHFILVDDGTKGKFGGEIRSRGEVEHSVAQLMSTGKFGSESPVSSVLLSIQGGPGTIDTILESLKHSTPVVIVNGSGKASNAVAYAKMVPAEGERENQSGCTKNGFDDLICNEFEIHRDTDRFNKLRDKCMQCVSKEYRDLIHVYHVEYDHLGVDGSGHTLDIAILDAVLKHNVEQWNQWTSNRTFKKDITKEEEQEREMQERLKKRDLSRVLRIELSLMWNRLDVLRKEMEDYCVLPSLAETDEDIKYTPADAEMTYTSLFRNEVILKPGDVVNLIKIRGNTWLIRPESGTVEDEGWVMGNMLFKTSTSSYVDMVKLAELEMLRWLMLQQKLHFTELFLQGMRGFDVTAFLGLRLRTLWGDAARFGCSTGMEKLSNSPMRIVLQTKGSKRSKVIIVDKTVKDHLHQAPKGRSWLTTFANRPADYSRASSTISHVSELSHEDLGNDMVIGSARAEAARKMLEKIQIFDESDVGLPSYAKKGWIADIAHTHLSVWAEKKRYQLKHEFTMTEETRGLIQGPHPDVPHDLRIELLASYQQNAWQRKAELFVKLLTHSGYIISRHEHRNQLDARGGISKIHDCDLLVDMVAQTRHNAWLRKKLEDRWAFGVDYSEIRKVSPYICLYENLDPEVQSFLCKYVRKQLKVLLEEGYWIWRPDMLERLYYDAALDPTTPGHVLRLFPNGQFWRSSLLNVVAKLMGPTYVHDFSTFSALDPYFHLMVWSIITKRFELVDAFWKKRMKDSIANGMVAAMLCEAICRDKEMSPDVRAQYLAQAFKFKKKTLGVFKACVQWDSTKTETLLTTRYPTAGWLQLWQLAYLQEKGHGDEGSIVAIDEDSHSGEGNGVEVTSDAFTSQEIFIRTVTKEWFGLVSEDNSWIKIMLSITVPMYSMWYVDGSEKESSTISPSLFSRYLAPLTLKVDTSLLRSAVAPTISWSPISKRLSLCTPTKNATIYYTIDNRDPVEFGLVYGPSNGVKSDRPSSKNGMSVVITEDGNADSDLDSDADAVAEDVQLEPSNLTLPEKGRFVIKCFAKADGLVMSAISEKKVDCNFRDMVFDHIPAFSIGPPPSKAHWSRYGTFGTAMFRMHSFYNATYVTFLFHLVLNLLYIVLFSYSAITPTFVLDAENLAGVLDLPISESSEKIIPLVVFGWTFIFAADEARQMAGLGFSEWWSSFWNKLDFFMYLNTFIVVCLRLNWEDAPVNDRVTNTPYRQQWTQSDRLMLARVMYALGAMVLWIRLTRMYSYSQRLGPKLVMIGEMFMDVSVFLALLIVVLIGYGVAMHAIMDPWRGADRSTLMTILIKPTFQMMGETFLSEIPEHTDCLGEDFTQCTVRVFDRNPHSRMPSVHMPARLKRACICPMAFLSGCHFLTG
jgi:leucine-rich repeat protein SHOC2